MQFPRDATTNASIFIRLRVSDAYPREIAWEEFSDRYVPVLEGFARRLGAKVRDVDDVVQDVLLGFFLKSATFVYDPSKGRFRSYLKVCAYRALLKRVGPASRLFGKSLDEVDPESLAVETVWNDVWEQQLLRRAVDEIRQRLGHTKTFVAFERYVLLNEPATTVAESLNLHIKSVYRAKDRITRLLRDRLSIIREEE